MRILTILYLLEIVIGAILGIDYGQKFTKAVILAPGAPYELILTEEARRKDASGISIRSSNHGLERVYGSAAQSLCTRFPSQCINGLKSIIGKSINDPEVHEYLSTHFGVNLIEDSDRKSIKVDLGLNNKSHEFSVEEIIAMNLRDIKSRALKVLSENPRAQSIIDGVSISVDPFVTQQQRKEILDSLELAEFSSILGIVDDGSAVAMNFLDKLNLQQKDYDGKKHYHIVYDIGAGSTKATLFSIIPFQNLTTVLELENIGYDASFGGDLLTKSIYNLIFEKLSADFGFDEDKELSNRVKSRLLEASEKAKIILSANNDYHISLESILDDRDFKAVITRQEFDEINIDNMARITKPILDVLKELDLYINDIESVILTGGSSRVPFIQKHVSTLVGEDKISKTVNADESCAVGTTIKGFKIKNKFSHSINKDYEIIEKVYHNYEISSNNEEFVVFPKFSKIEDTKRILLGELSDKLSLEMYEDGSLLESYNIDGIFDKTTSLTCNNDDAYKKMVYGVFEIDGNKIFSLKKVEAECVKEKGFFDGLLKKTVDEVEESGLPEEVDIDAKNSTDIPKKKTNKVLRPLTIPLPKPSYPKIKPIVRKGKRAIIQKLKYLDTEDENKIKLDNIRNSLEAACYSLRNYIADNENNFTEEVDLEEIGQKVSDTIEWLDFDSDSSTIEEFEAQLQYIESQKTKLEKFGKIKTTDLSHKGLTKLYEEGSSMLMKIQSRMLEFGSEVHEIRKKYSQEKFDFDKENERIKYQTSRSDEKILNLDKTMNEYKKQITDLGQLLDEDFGNKSQLELYDLYEAISDSIVSMLADLLIVEQSHKLRIEILNDKYDKLVLKRTRDEERQRLKEERKANKAAEVEAKAESVTETIATDTSITTDESETQGPDQSQDHDQSGSEKLTQSVENNSIDHDEL